MARDSVVIWVLSHVAQYLGPTLYVDTYSGRVGFDPCVSNAGEVGLGLYVSW